MAGKPVDTNRYHLRMLQRHALEPVSTAMSIARTEREEIQAEREALVEFAKRVRKQRTQPRSQATPSTNRLLSRATATPDETVCQIYQETIMSVPHYDDVYNESITKNAYAELGPDLGNLLSESEKPLTRPQRDALEKTARQLAERRASLKNTIDREVENLRLMSERLQSLMAELDNSTVPVWYQPKWEEQLETIHTARQKHLNERLISSPFNGHVCPYLYDEPPWSYPVLTAVVRLTESISVRD